VNDPAQSGELSPAVVEPPTDPLDAPSTPDALGDLEAIDLHLQALADAVRLDTDRLETALDEDTDHPDALTPIPTDELSLDGTGDEVPNEPTLDTAPEREIAEQSQRTDVALATWRNESLRRAEEFQLRTDRERAVLAERRTRLALGVGLGAFSGLLFLSLGAGFLAAGRAIVEPAAPPARVARTAREPKAAPAVVAKPVVAAVAAPVVEKAPRLAEPAPMPVAAPAPVERGPVVRDGRVWVANGFVFTEFSTSDLGPVRIFWRDGAHGAPLDPMGCGGSVVDGFRACKAGRSITRIESALAAGAQPGQWTVEACAGGACTPVGGFAVPFVD
jgi:hypothetical protein